MALQPPQPANHANLHNMQGLTPVHQLLLIGHLHVPADAPYGLQDACETP